MQILSTIATFTTAPLLLSALFTTVPRATRVLIQPASGSHVSFVEAAGVATGASDTTSGVIYRLAAYAASGILDHFDLVSQKESNQIDLASLQVDGTSGEAAKVSIFIS
jgi:hypothetical protein